MPIPVFEPEVDFCGSLINYNDKHSSKYFPILLISKKETYKLKTHESKSCEKCNISYDYKTNYCPSCGEKLVIKDVLVDIDFDNQGFYDFMKQDLNLMVTKQDNLNYFIICRGCEVDNYNELHFHGFEKAVKWLDEFGVKYKFGIFSQIYGEKFIEV